MERAGEGENRGAPIRAGRRAETIEKIRRPVCSDPQIETTIAAAICGALYRNSGERARFAWRFRRLAECLRKERCARPDTAARQGACAPREKSADEVRSEAAFRSYGGTIARPTTAEPPGQPPTVRDSETCGEPPPLRFPPRDERCSEIVGRSKKSFPERRRNADCIRDRRPPDRLSKIRGSDPGRRIWRRHRDGVGHWHL